jgi:hypothetical protein
VEEGNRLEDDVEARLARMDAAFERLAQLGDEAGVNDPGLPDAATAVRLDRDARDARDRGPG